MIADEHGGSRAPGSAGYDASADYVAGELEALGFEVDRQGVDFASFRENLVTLEIGNRSWSAPEWLHANIYSANGRTVSEAETVGIRDGEPTATSGCSAADWNGFHAGSIAIAFASACSRRQVVELAQDAGAAGLVSLYPTWERGRTLQPTLLDPAGLHTLAVVAGREPAEALLAAAAARTPVALTVDVEQGSAMDDNVLGELAGSTEAVLMVGGHLDSVLDGPGINDNGSGAAVLLALAAALADRPRPELTIRFAFWAAEEFGTHGSIQYVELLSTGEREHIRAYVNLDMVGSVDGTRSVYDDEGGAPGSGRITELLLGALDDLDAPGTLVPAGGASDHASFDRAGIATGGVYSGIDMCYHLACDDRSNIDMQMALELGNAVAAVVEELAY